MKESVRQAAKNMEQYMRTNGGIVGLPTGFQQLDKMTNGLRPGNMPVIAARPSMGKTALLLNIAENIMLKTKGKVLIFSAEMGDVELAERLLYARSGVSRSSLTKNEVEASKDDVARIKCAMKELAGAPIVIDDTAITIDQLRAKARRVKHRHPDLRAVFVDYLQQLKSNNPQAKNSREREIADISGSLKRLPRN